VYLGQTRYPVPRVDPSTRTSLAAATIRQTAKITARGWWDTVAWSYYANKTGVEGAANGSYVWDLGAGAGPLAVAQAVQLEAGAAPWAANRVAVQLARAGTPADNVRLWMCADVGGYPGPVVAACTLVPDANMQWLEGELTPAVTLAAGVWVWIMLSRTGGANDPSDYFQFVMDTGRGYRRGPLRRWDGEVWDPCDPDSTLCFRLWRTEPTTTQIRTMLGSAQFVTGVELSDAGWGETCPYRDGDSRLQVELLELLDMGASLAVRYRCVIDRERVAWVLTEESPENALILGPDRVLYGPHLERISPVADVSGRWIAISSCEWLAEVGHVGSASPVYVDRCEVDRLSGLRKVYARKPRQAFVPGPASEIPLSPRQSLTDWCQGWAGLRPFAAGWLAGG
jgi:hypothetical protein